MTVTVSPCLGYTQLICNCFSEICTFHTLNLHLRNTRLPLRLIAVFKRSLLQREYVQHVQGQVYKIVPFTNLNTYLHNDVSEAEVNRNINVYSGREKF
jgi:hypothetical protein